MKKIPKPLAQTQLEFQADQPLAPYTYMKVGGPAQFLTIAHTSHDLKKIILAAHITKLPITILGGGSNIVISDKGIDGLVVINKTQNIKFMKSSSHQVVVDSGVVVNRLIHQTIEHGLGGLETFLGIPGTVGGAVVNNSHYSSEMIGDYIHSVSIINSAGTVHTVAQKECKFAYDHSIFQKTRDSIISVTFSLTPNEPAKLKRLADKAFAKRRDTQPLSSPSSGCMFKNIERLDADKLPTPQKLTSAGYLIDQAGLKGLKVGGASVSQKHANFIVNTGNATAKDIKELSDLIIQKIKQKFGITLEREVFFIGK